MTALDSHPIFRARADEATALLRQPQQDRLVLARGATVVTTGIGCSEGPARAAAWTLSRHGAAARFEPITAVVGGVDADALVLFSQALSPNAKLALQASAQMAQRVLVTALAPAEDGVGVVRHGPDSEDGLLVRIVGPVAAMRVALSAQVGERHSALPDDLAERAAQASEAARAMPLPAATAYFRSTAIVTCGAMAELCHGLRWKWLETTGLADPPIYDVLNFAHGPHQRWHDEPLFVLALRQANDREAAWWQPFEALCKARGHSVAWLDATLPTPYSWFEHDAMLNVLLERALSLGIGHSKLWRGHGSDVGLYDLGAAPR